MTLQADVAAAHERLHNTEVSASSREWTQSCRAHVVQFAAARWEDFEGWPIDSTTRTGTAVSLRNLSVLQARLADNLARIQALQSGKQDANSSEDAAG